MNNVPKLKGVSEKWNEKHFFFGIEGEGVSIHSWDVASFVESTGSASAVSSALSSFLPEQKHKASFVKHEMWYL